MPSALRPLTFEVPGQPLPAPRPRFGRGRAYNKPEYTEFKGRVRMAAMAALNSRREWRMCERYRVTIYAAFGDRRLRDVDNIAKGPMDACNDLVWMDDKQVDDLRVRKALGCADPFLRVTVEVIEGEK